MCHVVAMALQYMSSNMYYYETDTFVFVIKLTKLTVLTFVSIGPGAMALNLIPYFPHSAASDLKTIINLKCHVQPKHLGCVPFNLWSGVLLLFFFPPPKKRTADRRLRFIEMTWIRICIKSISVIQDHSDGSRNVKGTRLTCLGKGWSVHLMYHDLSDLRSLILILIIPIEP